MRRQRRIDVLTDEFTEMLRLVDGIDARAKAQQIARQLAKSRIALSLPLARHTQPFVDRIGGLVHVVRKRHTRFDGA